MAHELHHASPSSQESVLDYYSAISEEQFSDTESVGTPEVVRKETFIPIVPSQLQRQASYNKSIPRSSTMPSLSSTPVATPVPTDPHLISSRIPVMKSQSQIRTHSPGLVTMERMSPSPSSSLAADYAKYGILNTVDDSPPSPNKSHQETMSRSMSQPANIAQTYNSLPSRRKEAISTFRRVSSVSTPAISRRAAEVEEKDASKLREEQIKRIHLINQAPTGRPPWWNTFQPDPSLPADQQLLPTVARRLALTRWIEEGGTEESFDDLWSIPVERSAESPACDTEDDDLAPPLMHVASLERPSTSMSTSSALSRLIIGQSPLKKRRSQLVLSGSTTNFSRRSNLSNFSTASPVSLGSQKSTDKTIKLSLDRNPTKRESKSSIRQRLETERLLQERASKVVQEREQTIASKPMANGTTKSRPISGFDFDELAKHKQSQNCCLMM